MIDYQARPRLAQKKQTLSTLTEKTIRSLIITLSAMIVILYIAFVMVTNASAQKGYSLEQVKLENENLKSINSNLSTRLIKTKTSEEISSKEKLQEMAETESKIYVEEADLQVN